MKCFSQFSRSLRARILTIICIFILPLNILTAVLCIRTIQNLDKTVESNLSQTLALLCNDINKDINILTVNNNRTQQEYWNQILLIDKNLHTGNELYTLWSQIRTNRTLCEFVDAGFLNPGNGEIISITYDRDRIPVEAADTLQQALGDFDFSALPASVLTPITLDDSFYFLWNINFTNLSYGYLISSHSLHELSSLYFDENEFLTISDAEGRILFQTGSSNVSHPLSVQNTIQDGIFTIQVTAARPVQSNLIAASMLLIIFITVCFLPLAWKLLRVEVLLPIWHLGNGMAQVKSGNLEYRLSRESATDDFQYVNQSFNDMVEKIQTLKIEAYEKELEKLQVEATNLRLQVNPHLLLNSLNMIFNLAQSQNMEVIKEYTIHLMKYFRYALRNTDRLVTLSSEMQFVSDYLAVQAIRFPQMIQPNCRYDSDLKDCLVPPLLIENFVENAINHGRIAGEVMHISVNAVSEENRLMIRVVDNGSGMNKETLDMLNQGKTPEDRLGRHIGVWNCRRRMRLFFGEDASLSFESIPNVGTYVNINLPIRKEPLQNESLDC